MTLAPERLEASQEDIEAVTRAAMDYAEAWYQGDAQRHALAYHPECVKRAYGVDPDTGVTYLDVVTPQYMVDTAATGVTIVEDCEIEVIIDDISEGIASVRAYSCRWVDFLHIVKARGEWKLFHVAYHPRQTEE